MNHSTSPARSRPARSTPCRPSCCRRSVTISRPWPRASKPSAASHRRQRRPTSSRTIWPGSSAPSARRYVAWTFNHLEPDDLDDLPAQIIWDNQAYRRRPKSGNRSLDSLFGPLRLQRVRYEPVEAGEPSLFPLEMALGIEADRATAALAERVGHAAAAHTQAGVRALLAQQHGVHWSVQTLRKVTAHLSAGLAEHRQAAQAAKLVEALQQATTSVGPHAPTVCVGRDGVMVPLRDRKAYGEASAATISVLDRRGRRRYTAYLGRMPEHGATDLIAAVDEPTLGLADVVAGAVAALAVPDRWRLSSDAVFSPGVASTASSAERPAPALGMGDRFLPCVWLPDETGGGAVRDDTARGGLGREDAALVAAQGWAAFSGCCTRRQPCMRASELSAAEQRQYEKAWNYLQKRKRRMDYAGCKRRGLAVGSGVTEAACKTVFTQRLKQSGMRWQVGGGQVIVDLRILVLSQVWQETHQAYLSPSHNSR